MTFIARAAGFAAAAFVALSFPAFADPSQAFELASPQIQSSYQDHSAATVDTLAAAPLPLSVEPISRSEPSPAVVAEHSQSLIAPEADGDEPDPKRSLLSLVDEYASADAPSSELECLAGAIYFESKGEPLVGQLAVAEVIINRSRSGRYPASMCGVVKQRGQFSFVRAGRLPPIPKASAHWRKAVAIAHIALKDLADSPAEDAISFHATYVSPGWRMKKVATVGNHVFYR